jgi:hypothetical protein
VLNVRRTAAARLLEASKADRKAFGTHRNRARNEFEHIGLHPNIDLDLEREAVSMLRRAISNYQKLDPAFRNIFRQFNQELWRIAQMVSDRKRDQE